MEYCCWTLGNILQWNLNWTLYIFIQENSFENVVWIIAAILSLTQCVNPSGTGNGILQENWVNTSVTNVVGQSFNTMRLRQNGRHFADDIFKSIFLNENVRILFSISLKLVPKGPNNNNPALVQIMAWCWPGDKSLPEPMVVRLPTHICVTQWVNPSGHEAERFYENWLVQYHGCWCPGSLRSQVLCSHGNDFVGPWLPWGRISTVFVIFMLRNDIKCKHIFMFLKNQSAQP